MNWNSFFGIKTQKYPEAEPNSRPVGANVSQPDIVAKDGSRICHVNTTNSKRPPAYDLSGKKDKTIIRLSEKQLTNLICIGKCTHKNITIIGTVSSKYGNTLLQNIFNTSQQLTYIRELQEEYLKKNKVDK